MSEAAPRRRPDPRRRSASSQLTTFTRFAEARLGRGFPDYAALHRFAVEDFRRFWALFLEWSALVVEGEVDRCARATRWRLRASSRAFA